MDIEKYVKVKYGCTQEVILRSVHVPSTTVAELIVTEKLT